MALTEEQRQYIEQTYQVKSPTAPTSGYDAAKDIARLRSMRDERKGFLDTIGEKTNQRVNDLAEGYMSGQNPISQGLQTVGAGAGIVKDITKEGVKRITPEPVKDFVKEKLSYKPFGLFGDILAEGAKELTPDNLEEKMKDSAIKVYESLEANPEAKRNLDAIMNIADVMFGAEGANIFKNVIKDISLTGLETVKSGLQAGKNMVEKGIEGAGKITSKITSKVEDVMAPVIKNAERFPERAATNIAERKAVEKSISELPSKTAQTAVRDGIDINDVKAIYQIPKEQKAQLQKLYQTAKNYSMDKTATDPIEVVGRPITRRLKELENARTKVGVELGEASKHLGMVKQQELFPSVFESLKKVPGLEGLTVDSKGVLNFKDTVLTTKETLTDREAIQSIFTQAVKGGTGEAKHRLRQELFEVLDGKKNALANITATQDKAYNAIRKGLSDVLETKNDAYKTLSREYAEIMQPLGEMRRIFKKTIGADEDIMDMSAGLFARRLTSYAKSNPEFRMLLREMDSVSKKLGISEASTEAMQDFYNILDKYYDIAGGTSFQGQIQRGVEKVGGVKGFFTKTAGELIGQTDAVKRKAFDDMMNEVFGGGQVKGYAMTVPNKEGVAEETRQPIEPMKEKPTVGGVIKKFGDVSGKVLEAGGSGTTRALEVGKEFYTNLVKIMTGKKPHFSDKNFKETALDVLGIAGTAATAVSGLNLLGGTSNKVAEKGVEYGVDEISKHSTAFEPVNPAVSAAHTPYESPSLVQYLKDADKIDEVRQALTTGKGLNMDKLATLVGSLPDSGPNGTITAPLVRSAIKAAGGAAKALDNPHFIDFIEGILNTL